MSMQVAALRARLSAAGFSLFAEGVVGPYNEELRAVDARFVLPDFGRTDARVMLIGNGFELYDAVRRAAREDCALRESANPIDEYAKAQIEAAIADLGERCEIRFTFDPPPRTFAAVRLARSLGLAEMGPTMLAIHPVRGPYMALRAAVVFDQAGTPAEPLESPCKRCAERPCVPAMKAALDAVGGAEKLDRAAILNEVEAMINARTACPIGRDYRYSEALLRYHYLHDRELLFE